MSNEYSYIDPTYGITVYNTIECKCKEFTSGVKSGYDYIYIHRLGKDKHKNLRIQHQKYYLNLEKSTKQIPSKTEVLIQYITEEISYDQLPENRIKLNKELSVLRSEINKQKNNHKKTNKTSTTPPLILKNPTNPTNQAEQSGFGYIYIIRKIQYEIQNLPIYKIGKTRNNNPYKRLNTYDKGSIIQLVLKVPDEGKAESMLMKFLLKSVHYKQRNDIDGNETFEIVHGNINTMISDVVKLLNDEQSLDDTNTNDNQQEDSLNKNNEKFKNDRDDNELKNETKKNFTIKSKFYETNSCLNIDNQYQLYTDNKHNTVDTDLCDSIQKLNINCDKIMNNKETQPIQNNLIVFKFFDLEESESSYKKKTEETKLIDNFVDKVDYYNMTKYIKIKLRELILQWKQTNTEYINTDVLNKLLNITIQNAELVYKSYENEKDFIAYIEGL